MIDKNDDIQQRNIDLLIAGYWYEDLPPVIDIANMKGKIKGIIEKIDNDIYDDFYKTDGIITEYKNTQAPSYIFNDGIEPITFFEFKKNGALREMQIPNLKYYCTFVYNTIAVYDELFSKLYSKPELIEDDVFRITIPLDKVAADEGREQKTLSEREQKIYNMICENLHLSVEQVMAELDISRATVFRDYAKIKKVTGAMYDKKISTWTLD